MNAAALIGDIVAAALKRETDFEMSAQSIAASELASKVAELIGVDASEAWEALCYVPDNMLTLLHSPQGWTALAGYIAGDLGTVVPAFTPTIH